MGTEGTNMADPFWTAIKEQLKELESAKNADHVIRILGPDRNPYGPNWDGMDGKAEGFFAGVAGDDVFEALSEAGWEPVWQRASYFYAMRAPDGSAITYIEGDIYRGDKR